MSTLSEILLKPEKRPAVVDDSCRVIDEEVAGKGGFSGIAIKTAYAVVKKVKPGFVRDAVDHMLDDFVKRLEPFHAQAQAQSTPTGSYLSGRPGEVADALLAITDERAARAKNEAVKKAYQGLRPSAK